MQQLGSACCRPRAGAAPVPVLAVCGELEQPLHHRGCDPNTSQLYIMSFSNNDTARGATAELD